MDILRVLYDGGIRHCLLHGSVPGLVDHVTNRRETKNRTLEEIELIFNNGAGRQVRGVLQHFRRGVDANYDQITSVLVVAVVALELFSNIFIFSSSSSITSWT